MPLADQWLTFAEWGRKWGEHSRLSSFPEPSHKFWFTGSIVSVNLMGQTMVIINSAKVLDELEKKSSVYSDRPRLEMAGELVGYAKTLVLLSYGPRFRNYRRHFARLLGTTSAVQQFHSMQISETHRFLKRVLADPDNLNANLRKYVHLEQCGLLMY
jgi:hypothetical protein